MSAPSAAGPRLAIVTVAWNCEAWIKRSLASIRDQTYRNFHCVVIDDLSPDRTYDYAREAVKGDERFTVIRTPERRYQLANAVEATKLAAQSPDDVVVIVDGDDWLKHDRVFEQIAAVYADPQVWLTYGNYELLKRNWREVVRRKDRRGTRKYPEAVEKSGLYRYHPFLAGHLRTYRKFLFDAVKDEDLRDEDGNYYWAAGDAAIGFPMLEMATQSHIRYLDEILYVYNNDHPFSDNRPQTRERKLLVKLRIAARPRYFPLVLSSDSPAG